MTASWVIRDVIPLGQPVDADGVAILYERDGGSVSLVGVDPDTGKTLWTHEATPSWTTPGVAMTPNLVGPEDHPLVAMFAPASSTDLNADLVILDPDTGKVVHTTPDNYFSTWPTSCRDETAVCVTAYDQSSSSWDPMRLDLTNGTFTNDPAPAAAAWPNLRDIGPEGLIETGVRKGGPEEIARVVDGKAVWHFRTSDVFGPGATTDNGWSFHQDTEGNVLWGYVGVPFIGPNAHPSVDLTKYLTAGFDTDTGELLWVAPHTQSCGDTTTYDETPAQPVRCSFASGTVTYEGRLTSHPKPIYRDLNSALEGFDPTTGKTTWTLPLGDDHTFLSSKDPIAMATATEAVVHTKTGTLVVDLSDGTQRPTAPDEVFGCMKQTTYKYKLPRTYYDQQVYLHQGARLASLCDATAKPVNAAMTTDLAALLGTQSRNTLLVAGGHTLAGYPA